MNVLKTTAGVLGFVDSLLGMYFAYTEPILVTTGSLTGYLFWFSVVLLLVSLLCIYGVHYAFPAAAVVAAAVGLVSPFSLASRSGLQWALVALSAIVVLTSLVAFRSRARIDEQANPMNLPVFG